VTPDHLHHRKDLLNTYTNLTLSPQGSRPRTGSHRESDNHYRAIVAHLNADWRVIECKDGMQWILQHRYGDQWKGKSFCRSRDALIRIILEKGEAIGPVSPAAIVAVRSLPRMK
jgi:hypothetical protein